MKTNKKELFEILKEISNTDWYFTIYCLEDDYLEEFKRIWENTINDFKLENYIEDWFIWLLLNDNNDLEFIHKKDILNYSLKDTAILYINTNDF